MALLLMFASILSPWDSATVLYMYEEKDSLLVSPYNANFFFLVVLETKLTNKKDQSTVVRAPND